MALLARWLQTSWWGVGRRASCGPWLAQRAAQAFSSSSLSEALGQGHSDAYHRSIHQPESFWGELARKRLRWTRPFVKTMDCDVKAARIRWFEGGALNVSGELEDRRTEVVGLVGRG